jgi:hypothetical protein
MRDAAPMFRIASPFGSDLILHINNDNRGSGWIDQFFYRGQYLNTIDDLH